MSGFVEAVAFVVLPLIVTLLWGGQSVFSYRVHRQLKRDGDQDAACYALNESLTAAGIASACLWLVLANNVNGDDVIMRNVLIGSLVALFLFAIWLWWRIRVKG